MDQLTRILALHLQLYRQNDLLPGQPADSRQPQTLQQDVALSSDLQQTVTSQVVPFAQQQHSAFRQPVLPVQQPVQVITPVGAAPTPADPGTRQPDTHYGFAIHPPLPEQALALQQQWEDTGRRYPYSLELEEAFEQL